MEAALCVIYKHNINVPLVRIQRNIYLTARKQTCQNGHLPERLLSIDNMHPGIKAMEYAPRGPLMIRAGVLEKELKSGAEKPFTKIIRANLGDAHAMGQHPFTFMRQVLALVQYPPLLEDKCFPEDAKKRACNILAGCAGGSIGAYTESVGIEIIRKDVAKFIERRDCFPADWRDIVLGIGATDLIQRVLKLFVCDINGKKPGIMIPIPQYPLYSATLTEYNMHQIEYYLDESKEWGLNIPELERAVCEAREHCHPRVLVVINPGNPTGQVLTKDNIKEVIKFALKEKMFLFADEVYQDNIYGEGAEFHSFKKVCHEMGAPYSKMEMASFVSVSKGHFCECGLRGGYVELCNLCPKVKDMFFKSLSVMLCPPTMGQTAIDVLANPPHEGEPSYPQYLKELKHITDSLRIKAKLIVDTFNGFEGFQCNRVQGAMYAFPQIKLPPKAVEVAKEKNMAPDTFYATELLETHGICIVPGSGFGQNPGTYHFRTTILPPLNLLKEMLDKFYVFHRDFLKKYG